MSAAHDTPIDSGGSSEVCFTKESVNFWSEKHVWHELYAHSMALVERKEVTLHHKFSWCFEGWSSLICNAVTRPCKTERGTMITSVEGTRGSLRRTTNVPSLAKDATERYLLILVVFLEGRVLCFKWACVLRKSGQSVCMANEADLVVKGKRVWLSMISWTCTDLTTESFNCVMNEQIWQRGSVHSDALRLAKSDGIFTEPLRCRTLIWYLLTVDRNNATRGLAETSPLLSFSTACTQGLLSVNKQVLCVDWIM